MNTKQAIKKIYDTVPYMQPGDKWMVLSKDNGEHCTLTNVDRPEDAGYSANHLVFEYQHKDADTARRVFQGLI